MDTNPRNGILEEIKNLLDKLEREMRKRDIEFYYEKGKKGDVFENDTDSIIYMAAISHRVDKMIKN